VPSENAMAAHRRDVLIARAQRARSVGEVFATASTRLRHLVPFDSAVWLATDPATSMPTAPTRKENLDGFDADDCMRVWEREFLVEDLNPYRDLAHDPVPAAALRLTTDDRPARSTRFREFLEPFGIGDELRLVVRADGAPWAWISLYRNRGTPAFDAGEVALVGSLSQPLAHAMRDHARPGLAPEPDPAGRGPGLMLFSPDGELISVNADALAWLEELPPPWDSETGAAEPGPRFGPYLPIPVVGTLMRARAVAADRDPGPARARMRSAATGRWLVCHASCLRNSDGTPGDTALVIEPAQASEIAPLIAQAYALSPREREITELIARGFATAAIAEQLYLSPHTVRDYVKDVFGKVGVSSRGELVARLFAEHYAPTHLDPAQKDGVAYGAHDYSSRN
jgi:DNA-binding CsgD family transcriptional regulator